MATVLFSIPYLNDISQVEIMGRIFKIKIIEECWCVSNNHQEIEEEDNDAESDVSISPATPNSDTVKAMAQDLRLVGMGTGIWKL